MASSSPSSSSEYFCKLDEQTPLITRDGAIHYDRLAGVPVTVSNATLYQRGKNKKSVTFQPDGDDDPTLAAAAPLPPARATDIEQGQGNGNGSARRFDATTAPTTTMTIDVAAPSSSAFSNGVSASAAASSSTSSVTAALLNVAIASDSRAIAIASPSPFPSPSPSPDAAAEPTPSPAPAPEVQHALIVRHTAAGTDEEELIDIYTPRPPPTPPLSWWQYGLLTFGAGLVLAELCVGYACIWTEIFLVIPDAFRTRVAWCGTLYILGILVLSAFDFNTVNKEYHQMKERVRTQQDLLVAQSAMLPVKHRRHYNTRAQELYVATQIHHLGERQTARILWLLAESLLTFPLLTLFLKVTEDGRVIYITFGIAYVKALISTLEKVVRASFGDK